MRACPPYLMLALKATLQRLSPLEQAKALALQSLSTLRSFPAAFKVPVGEIKLGLIDPPALPPPPPLSIRASSVCALIVSPPRNRATCGRWRAVGHTPFALEPSPRLSSAMWRSSTPCAPA